jgi:glycosyltransferase involved in cell wall biosynthesis
MRSATCAAVESVMQQEVDGPAELVLALGPSTDATDAIARELAAADARSGSSRTRRPTSRSR